MVRRGSEEGFLLNRAKHLADWDELWKTVTNLRTTRTEKGDRFARESFELVRVALIYQRNALEMYSSEGELHKKLRPPEEGIQPASCLDGGELLPTFPNLMASPDPRLGGVFVASASFRLPVAVLKAVELSACPFQGQELRTWLKDSYWNGNAVSEVFDDVKQLGCCESPLGSAIPGKLCNALAIALVHRDDFGHGEVGHSDKGMGKYRKEREGVLDSLYVCRILQAQRELCQWTLARLKSPAPVG